MSTEEHINPNQPSTAEVSGVGIPPGAGDGSGGAAGAANSLAPDEKEKPNGSAGPGACGKGPDDGQTTEARKTEQTVNDPRDSQTINSVGRDAIFNNVSYFATGKGHKQPGDEVDLSKCLTQLSPRSPDMPRPAPEDLDKKLSNLRQRRIIFISCADEEIALAMAHAIIDGLRIDDKDKWLLTFDDSGIEDSERNINLFMRPRKDPNSEMAIVVHMRSNSATQFWDSLAYNIKPGVHEDVVISSQLEGALNRNHYFMIGLVRPEHIENRLRHSRYPYWEVAFLPYLLGDYAHLQQRILDQRARGKWYKDDEQFCREVRNFISNGQILAQVEARENSVEETTLDSLFKGDNRSTAADFISDTVLYAATFFPALNPGEFKQVVSSLLGERTMTVTTPVHKQSATGVSEPFEAQKEEPLKQVWQTISDKILKACRLKTISAKDSTRTICFSEPGLKERLKAHIEEEHNFFLEDQFQAALAQGLLFNNSSNISEGMRRLIVEMSLSYRDHFDQHWLIGVIEKLKAAASDEPSDGGPVAPELAPFLKIQGNRIEWCYARISELLREMLGHQQLRGLVDEFLNRLMGVNFHGSVLRIIRRLQFAPEFDLLYWVRQLLGRGSPEVRYQTYVFLVQYLIKAGPHVYEPLRVIRNWLPSPDSELKSYSVTNLCALELMFRYCHETTLQFSATDYGLQPSRFPLFSGDNLNVIKDNSDLLAKWLFHPGTGFFAVKSEIKLIAEWFFHPGMKSVLNEDINLTISTLIVNWALILIGPNKDLPLDQSGLTTIEECLGQAEQAQDNPDLTINNGLILGLFLRAVATNIKQPQLEALCGYWKFIAELMSESIEDLPYTGTQRQEAICIRNLVRDLARQFKGYARSVRAQTKH